MYNTSKILGFLTRYNLVELIMNALSNLIFIVIPIQVHCTSKFPIQQILAPALKPQQKKKTRNLYDGVAWSGSDNIMEAEADGITGSAV